MDTNKGYFIAITMIAILVLLNLAESSLYYTGNISLTRNSTWSANLTGLIQSSLAFGDIDDDGDLDMILAGCSSGGIHTCATADKIRVYVNNGTSLVENYYWGQNLSSIGHGSLALGDLDNDADLDLVISGDTGGGSGIVRIYTNNGTSLVENQTWQQNLIDVDAYAGTVALGDVNNDGRLDLALVGAYPSSDNGIYINNGTALLKDPSWIEIPYIGHGSTASLSLGDIDNDGDLDLMFFGFRIDFYKGIYLNNGTSLVKNTSWEGDILNEWGWPSHTLGDYDNDGDLDLLIMGTGGTGGDKLYVFNNTDYNYVYQQRVSSFFEGSTAWGDYDNDGDLDIAAMGKEEGKNTISNNNATFFQFDNTARADLKEDDMQRGSLSWADVDKDGDLDLTCSGLSHGDGYMTKIYTSNASTQNTKPNPPLSNFNNAYNFSTGKLILSWSTGSDSETPALGLYYNLRVGTCSGCHDVVSGVFGGGDDNGYFGNMMQRKAITLNRPDLANKTVYWAAQTIDTGLAKSAWSTEQVYVIGTCVEDWSYSEWSSCFGGTQTRTAVDLNSCGTTDNRSALSQSCTSPPSGPPGPGVPPPSPIDPSTATKEWSSIGAGEEGSFVVNRANVSVTEIRIKTREAVSQALMTITRQQGNAVTAEPEGRVYQYIEIIHQNLEGKLSEVVMSFAVDPAWINVNDVNTSTVALNRYVNGSWEELETRMMRDGEDYSYESTSPGLSYFAITGDENLPVMCNESETRCGKTGVEVCSVEGTWWELIEECPYGCENATCLEAICEAGLLRCNGSVVEQCNVVRWIALETCEFGCISGRCLPSPFYHELLIVAVLVAIGVLLFLFFVRKRHGKD